MMLHGILEGMWSGEVRVMGWTGSAPGLRRLAAMLPGDTLYLETPDPMRAPAIRLASDEVEPGLTLADLLAEEMDLYPAEGTLIVVTGAQPVLDAAATDRLAGEAVRRLCALIRSPGQGAGGQALRRALARAARGFAETAGHRPAADLSSAAVDLLTREPANVHQL